MLDGKDSYDPDNDIVSYIWKQVSGTPVRFDTPREDRVSGFYAPNVTDTSERLNFQLTVRDAENNEAWDFVHITVLDSANQPPVAEAGPDITVESGDSILLDAGASSDPEGESLEYAWSFLDGSVSFSDAGPDMKKQQFITYAPEVGKDGGYMRFSLLVRDAGGLEDQDALQVNILQTMDPPVADAGPDRTYSSGEMITLSGRDSWDPDSAGEDSLRFYWEQVTGSPILIENPYQETISFVPLENPETQVYAFQLKVTDKDGLSDLDTCKITVLGTRYADDDGDGYTENQGDFNDGDPGIHPGAQETCGDGIDQDCDGGDSPCVAPEDADDDGDGYTENQGDFNDGDPGIHPGAQETCGDGIDQDCDGTDTPCVAPEDADNDGDGYTENQGDCNDGDPGIHPGAQETCGDGIDQDCDGTDTPCVAPEDADNDGDGYTENQGDCNDGDPGIYPGAQEICGDGIDQDCDGGDSPCVAPEDADNDGDGYTENQGDCNDGDPGIHPGAQETCGDGIDQDCDGADPECGGGGDSGCFIRQSGENFSFPFHPWAGFFTGLLFFFFFLCSGKGDGGKIFHEQSK